MKRLFSILAASLFAGAAHAATFSVDFFHDNLEAHGDWREVGDYGYCWQPRDVDRNWRPYRDGRWLYTDAGWTWDSDEPYSWAVYHYGRWARVDGVGWVWVPGTEWGPAWVSWRRSERHVGWAPLPPEATFTRSIGFSARVDADYDIGPTNYSFVNTRDFGSRRLSRVIIAPTQNVTIINRTTNITNITYVNNTVINNGPQYEVIAQQSAQPIRRMKLDRREDFAGNQRSVVEGDSLRVAAPTFDAKPATAPRKVAAKVEKVELNRGWKGAGSTAEVAKLRSKIKDEPAVLARPKPAAEPVKDTPEKSNQMKTPTKNEPPKGKPAKADPPKPKPAVIAKPVTAEESRAAAKKEKPPVPKVEPRKSKATDGPVREETKQQEKVQPGKDAPPRQVERKTPKLPDPKPVAQEPTAKKPSPPKPVAKKPEAKKPAAPAPQPVVPPTEPAKGKGKKKDKTDEVKPDENL